MRRALTLLTAAVALTAPAVASAGAPDGFTAQAGLSIRASYVAGKPVTAWCPGSDAAWNNYVAAASNGSRAGADINGFVLTVGASDMYLSPDACLELGAKLRGGKLDYVGFGRFLLTLTHEAEHLAGHADEGETECAALAAMPAFMRHSWGMKSSAKIARVMESAWAIHGFAPSIYHGTCG